MLAMIGTGLVAGGLLGFVLQRAGLCFHSMFAGAWAGRTRLLQTWLVGVALAMVGLSLVYLSPASDGLNAGLAFRPVGNVVGGLVIGAGMAVARSCASGLFYKLGAGMLGATVGILGWVVGELAASRVDLRGPTVLGGGEAGTLAGVLGLPRLAVAAVLGAVLIGAAVTLARRAVSQERPGPDDDSPPHRPWPWPTAGAALGLVVIAGWWLASLGGASFGPSTVGASVSIAAGSPQVWLIAFLVGLVPGAHVAARLSGDWRPRGETRVRYGQLAVGGVLLGAGGWVAGGCNVGHGLSGVAQRDVASFVAVAAMAVGVLLTRRVLDGRVSRAVTS